MHETMCYVSLLGGDLEGGQGEGFVEGVRLDCEGGLRGFSALACAIVLYSLCLVLVLVLASILVCYNIV